MEFTTCLYIITVSFWFVFCILRGFYWLITNVSLKPIFTGFFSVSFYFCVFILIYSILEINVLLLYMIKKQKISQVSYLIKNNKQIKDFMDINCDRSKFKINKMFLDLNTSFFDPVISDFVYKTDGSKIYLNKLSLNEYCSPNPKEEEIYKLTRTKFIEKINQSNLLKFKLTPSLLFFGIYNLLKEEQFLRVMNYKNNKILKNKEFEDKLSCLVKIPDFNN